MGVMNISNVYFKYFFINNSNENAKLDRSKWVREWLHGEVYSSPRGEWNGDTVVQWYGGTVVRWIDLALSRCSSFHFSIELYNCQILIMELHSFRIMQMHSCPTKKMYSFTTVQLYNCTTVKTVQLYNWTTLLFYNCITVNCTV